MCCSIEVRMQALQRLPGILYDVISQHRGKADEALYGGGDLFCRLTSECCVTLVFQVKDLTKFLDPSGLGVISFEDFHRGISAISNGGESQRRRRR